MEISAHTKPAFEDIISKNQFLSISSLPYIKKSYCDNKCMPVNLSIRRLIIHKNINQANLSKQLFGDTQ